MGEFTIISSYFGLTLNGAKYFFSLGKIVQELKVAFNRTHQVLTLQKEESGSIITNEISTIRANVMDDMMDIQGSLWGFSMRRVIPVADVLQAANTEEKDLTTRDY